MTLSIALPAVLAAVLIASGVAKLRRPDDLQGWRDLGVPEVLRREWLVRLHPWGELLLGAALVLLGGVLGILAALASLALMVAYLWLVADAVRAPVDTSCACFGTRTRITRVTVARNAWLTLLAGATAAVIGFTPLWGGALAAATAAEAWLWLVMLAIAAATTAVILWPAELADQAEPVVSPGRTVPGSAADEELDYIRTRTPSVPVTTALGEVVDLRSLASRRPVLLLAVSETCGSCAEVIAQTPVFRDRLPEVDVRLLLRTEPGQGLTEPEEPQSLHDPSGYVRGSIADWPVPTAVLLGMDGLLAGGPVSGTGQIADFVDDIYASLHEMEIPELDGPPHASSELAAQPPAGVAAHDERG